jgi:C_GCAxxG_C_C family probable redox protein
MENFTVQRIDEVNVPQLKDLLKKSNLPFSDIDAFQHQYFGLFDGEALIGSVGVEQYGTYGLFRSLAVKSDLRSRGLGKQLHSSILDYCLHTGIKTLYLLTTTASHYFGKFGWEIIRRDDTPESIQQSKEFASICPSTAICMMLHVFKDNVDYAVKIFAAGFNCSQSVFVPIAVDMGIPASKAFKLSTGFGAGMVYRGETCGAITGAMMALGLVYGRSKVGDTNARDKTYKIINQLYDEFKKKHGTLLCKELLNADISNPEELKRVGMAGAFTTICPYFVNDAALITDLLLKENS